MTTTARTPPLATEKIASFPLPGFIDGEFSRALPTHKRLERRQGLLMEPRAILRKATEDDPGGRWRRRQHFGDGFHRNPGGAIGGETIDSGRDGGKSDRHQLMLLAKLQRTAIAGRKQILLAELAAIPHRPNGVDHVFRRKPISPGDLGVTGLAAVEHAALGHKLGSGGAMNRAINPTPA